LSPVSDARGRLVAAFDFDGTITHRDTLVPFLRRLRGLPRFTGGFIQALPAALTAPDRREAYKAAVFQQLLTGVPAEDLAASAVDYGRELPAQFRPDMVERIRWHQEAGHEVVIVSASLRAYLDPVVEHLGLDGVCAVELEVADDGRLTGRMVGPNCRGPEKVVRLTDWLGGDTPEHLWAYGNSSGDQDLLAVADEPVWVGRRR
jgi:phosphatidylglycerophosphatase C